MLWARKYECSDIFHNYKYIGEHSCGVEHANSSHRKITIKVIASLCSKLLKMLEGWCGCQGNGPRDSGEWIFMLTGFFLHTFFFEKLKEIVVDESDLCFIFDRHKSFANDIVNVYNHAHHGYCLRHLSENLRNKCITAAIVLEHDIGFEKWSRAHFPGNRYDVMTTNIAESLNVKLIDEREYLVASIFNSIAKRFGELFRERHAYILKSVGNQMVPTIEKIGRKKMIQGDSLYGENVIGNGNQFTVFGAGVTANVNLLEKSCSCRQYDLIKIPCAHAMAS
ncbi:hypothetical protein KY284_036421 [Solanum tuberosum]|nr:hypothetical protein KY284_036421 [Solanum tuberosum]